MLTPGARFGPYEIVLPLGAGGMGEVYRASDGRLNRDVAIKVLPPAVAADADRLARFRREAQTLAVLNHPNIAHIHGLEEIDGLPALVMELVEGEDLAARLTRGPIPLDEALPIARQIADALDAAHAQGIVHRDLKPANVMVRADGTVKVLDFGLAKAMAPLSSSAAAAALAMSPTLTSPAALTGAGVILGTAAYMSPEQARGKTVDTRSDLWAFGALLFEMLAGSRAFRGDDVTDTIASVIAKAPDWTRLPVDTPPAIRRLLRRCLEKDRHRRLSDAADARLEIDEALAPPSGDATLDTHGVPARRGAAAWIAAGVVGAGLGALLVLLAWTPWRKSPPVPPLRLSADPGAGGSLALGLGDIVALSPDGTVASFVAHQGTGRPQLYLRPLNQLRASPLPGTDDASSPFFSPDGQWIGFFANDRLKKIAVTGGAVVTLCDAPNGRGGSWGEDGDIVFARYSQNAGWGVGVLLRVSSAGGTPRQVAALSEGQASQRWPQVLPGGRAVLFTVSRDPGDYADADLVIQPLNGGAQKIVQRAGYHGRYLPNGYLAYIHDETLFAAPFDLERLEVTGPPVPLIEDVTSNASTGAAQFAASGNGTLLYLAGKTGIGVPISWWNRDGTITPLRVTPANWFALRFSPDGRRLAMNIPSARSGIWIYDHEQDTVVPLTDSVPTDSNPVWAPDGRRIAFASERGGKAANVYWQATDGTGGAQRLTESANKQSPGSWSPDGKILVYQEQVATGNIDLMLLPLEGADAKDWKPGTPTVFLSTPFSESEPAFSPDGRWLAYVSDESGRHDVYVRPFHGSGKWKISIDGGAYPTWSRTKPELFYSTPDGQIMNVPTAVDGDSFRPGKPRPWAEGRFAARVSRMFDLHPDGERFAIAPQAELAPGGQEYLNFIFNVFDELRRIAPATKR